MLPVRRKLLEGFSSRLPSALPHARSEPAASSVQADNPQALAKEYLAWARWLDDLRQHAGDGGEQAARALADGKLGFILRRCLVLREKTMLGGTAGHVLLEEVASLASELKQVVGELTGRTMPAVDEWPLPYRLYSRQADTQPTIAQPPRDQRERRRHGGQRRNHLTADELHDAQQAHGCLLLVLQLLQRRQPALAESATLQAASLDLEHARDMGFSPAMPTT
ncbi:hypothetical protein [Vogesella oryzae]|uniref:hypothetical protein n=1 Tax=Vogesella oryzae TaxID=1735285 RepID=UPI0015816B6D|nr:hypothetical protein [Vogesella oryzae]